MTSSTTSEPPCATPSPFIAEARNDDLLLTEPVASDPAVAALLSERGIEPEIVATSLAGHRHLIRVTSPLDRPRLLPEPIARPWTPSSSDR